VPDAPPDTTEARILDAAHRVFLRRGVDGARTQEIADEAGVNKALLHYYFRTKERLAEAVFLRAAGQLFPGMAAALGADVPVEERVRRVVAFESGFLAANPYLPGYILGELRAHPERMKALIHTTLPVEQLRAGVLGGLQAELDRAAAEGRLRPFRAEEFLVNLVSLIVFPFAARPMLELVLGLDGEAFDAFLARRTEGLADFFLRALRP
jgi:TetR/AcrR family transcriptional regulator